MRALAVGMHWDCRRLYTWQGHDISCDRYVDGGVLVRLSAHADAGTTLASFDLDHATWDAARAAGKAWLVTHGRATAEEEGGHDVW